MAMVVRSGGLEYLGWMGYANGGPDFQATLADLEATAANPPVGPLTFIVSAWLGWSGELRCPASLASRPPSDTPFETCPYARLTAAATPAGTTSPLADAVHVQWQAYQDFAPGATLASTDAKYGTYLVRLVVDTRQGINGPRGWQVVARLAP
jgi:hypothetical protein